MPGRRPSPVGSGSAPHTPSGSRLRSSADDPNTISEEDEQSVERKKSGKRRRVYQRRSPLHMRHRLQESYEEPKSGRESWWRSTIKETPNPGSYDSQDFIIDLGKKPNSYSFKSDGRRIDPQPQIGKGALLLPGAYRHTDLAQRMDATNYSYGFKNTSRDSRDCTTVGRKDKDVNISPDAYETSKYLTLTVEKQPSRHWQFRSQSERFPTLHFKPKEGPAPGKYEYSPSQPQHVVSSTFKSKTPRFGTSHSKVPAPGTYDQTVYTPLPRTIASMARNHGIFFPSANLSSY